MGSRSADRRGGFKGNEGGVLGAVLADEAEVYRRRKSVEAPGGADQVGLVVVAGEARSGLMPRR